METGGSGNMRRLLILLQFLYFCAIGCIGIKDPVFYNWQYAGDLIPKGSKLEGVNLKPIVCDDIEVVLRGIYSHPGHIAIELKLYSETVDRETLKKRASNLVVISKRFGQMRVYDSNFRKLPEDTLAYYSALSLVSDTLIDWYATDNDEYRIDLSPLCPGMEAKDLEVTVIAKKVSKPDLFLKHIEFY
jgi:hypothetical protein